MRTSLQIALSAILVAVAACGGEADQSPEASGSNTTPEAQASAAHSSRDADFAALPSPYNEASYSLGRRTFKSCGSCHTLKSGGQDLVGPNLHGIIGRAAGTKSGFRYSEALSSAGFAWTPEKLEQWLSNPKGFLPGNNMTFSGVHRPADRQAVIAYIMLETEYDSTTDQTNESAEQE